MTLLLWLLGIYCVLVVGFFPVLLVLVIGSMFTIKLVWLGFILLILFVRP